jgi:hypothetical protein
MLRCLQAVLISVWRIISMQRLNPSTHKTLATWTFKYVTNFCRREYGVIHNSLTHYKKMVRFNSAKDGNMRHTDRKRNLSSLFCLPICTIYSPFWRDRRQADNPFLPIPAAASHDRLLRWQRWFVFASFTLEFFIPLLYAVLHRLVLSELGSKTSLHRHDQLCSSILKRAKCLQCSRRHFHSTCTPGGYRCN